MAAAAEAGTSRILFRDATGIRQAEVLRAHSIQVSEALLAPAGENRQALPTIAELGGDTSVLAEENSDVVWQFLGDAADIVESEASDIELPVQLINKVTGAVTNRILKGGDNGDFVGFSSTDDVTTNTSEFVVLGAFTVPNGHRLRLSPFGRVHIFVGDDT